MVRVNISYHRSSKDIPALRDDMRGTEYNWRSTTIAFDELVEFVCDGMVQYSPYRFRDGYRSKDNVIRNGFQNLLVFDIDDGKTMSECMELLIDYTFMIATTKSHQKDKKGKVCDRFRILIPMINAPSDDEVYQECLNILGNSLGADKQANMIGSAFLGYELSEYVFNYGSVYNLDKIAPIANENVVKKERARELRRNLAMKRVDKDTSGHLIDTIELKERMDISDSVEILMDLGIEVIGKKITVRNERTKSTQLYDNGKFFDFGTQTAYDIFDILQILCDMSFKESLSYVSKYMEQ